MKGPTILVLADSRLPQLGLLEPLRSRATIVAGRDLDTLLAAAPEATILFNWGTSREIVRAVFEKAPKLKWVHSRSAGLDNLLFPELVAGPVPLTNGTGVYSPALGEFALAAILYFAKDFRRLIRQQGASVWQPFDVEPIAGKTLGIVGYGDIGRAIAVRAQAFGMTILALKRSIPEEGADPLVAAFYPTDRCAAMISGCDYIVVAAPLTPDTAGLIGQAEFAAMKSNAVLINIGRGPIVDEAALIDALTNHRIKGAALDVFDREPLPADSPFYSLENVLLSPHCADNTPDWKDNAMRFFLAQFERFEKGQPLLNIVDKHRGY